MKGDLPRRSKGSVLRLITCIKPSSTTSCTRPARLGSQSIDGSQWRFAFVVKFASGARRPKGPEARGWKPAGPKPGAARVWCATAVPGGASQQVCGFKKSLRPSSRLAYSEEVSQFFLISLRIFQHTVRMSRNLRRHKLAGGLTVLGDHERVPLLEELHDPPETPPCLRCADHLHAEALTLAELS